MFLFFRDSAQFLPPPQMDDDFPLFFPPCFSLESLIFVTVIPSPSSDLATGMISLSFLPLSEDADSERAPPPCLPFPGSFLPSASPSADFLSFRNLSQNISMRASLFLRPPSLKQFPQNSFVPSTDPDSHFSSFSVVNARRCQGPRKTVFLFSFKI